MKYYFSSTVIFIITIISWEIAAKIVDKAFILPSPSAVIVRLWELKFTLFLVHLPKTLLIILVGLSISIVFGIVVGICMSLNKSVERALYPILIASQTIPIIALAPIFVLWFGYSIWSKVVVTVLITFFPITVSVFDGLKASSKEFEELFLTMGATKQEIFLKLNIPNALPYFFSGLKVAVTLSVIGAAIGEWLGAQAGLGYFSRRMMTQFDGPAVFAPILLLSAVGILLFLLVTWIEKYMVKWRKER
ncbi:ABC transporter permease [Bacillus sp. Marseille-P3661]|uniref:ABC transporter permease n=1 Tax=Bacillus sp. Marseille-P3661 TaxID=1936234 RepID=UPI000C842C88|nr:ABC transporter permease [Bacillus sp. Marseille-P3661]